MDSKKNFAVVFTENGARILKLKKGVDSRQFKQSDTRLLNPEIPRGVPPHYWKNVGGKIVEMTDEEKRLRDGHVDTVQPRSPILYPKSYLAASAAVGAAVGSLLTLILKSLL